MSEGEEGSIMEQEGEGEGCGKETVKMEGKKGRRKYRGRGDDFHTTHKIY